MLPGGSSIFVGFLHDFKPVFINSVWLGGRNTASSPRPGHFTTDIQSVLANLSPLWYPWTYFPSVGSDRYVWRTLPDERTGLSFISRPQSVTLYKVSFIKYALCIRPSVIPTMGSRICLKLQLWGPYDLFWPVCFLRLKIIPVMATILTHSDTAPLSSVTFCCTTVATLHMSGEELFTPGDWTDELNCETLFRSTLLYGTEFNTRPFHLDRVQLLGRLRFLVLWTHCHCEG